MCRWRCGGERNREGSEIGHENERKKDWEDRKTSGRMRSSMVITRTAGACVTRRVAGGRVERKTPTRAVHSKTVGVEDEGE